MTDRPARTARALLLLALAAAGCAGRGAPEEGVAREPTPADRALRCARLTAQDAGFQVRMPDPREPWLLIADWRGPSPNGDRIVVRVVPGSGPEDRAHVVATAEGPRTPSGARTEAMETAMRIEMRCGAPPG